MVAGVRAVAERARGYLIPIVIRATVRADGVASREAPVYVQLQRRRGRPRRRECDAVEAAARHVGEGAGEEVGGGAAAV